MWNQSFQRVQIVNVFNPQAPVSHSDRINSVVFTNSIFGQSFGSGTLAVTYYSSSGSNMVEADTLFNRAGGLRFLSWPPAVHPPRRGDRRYPPRFSPRTRATPSGLGHPDSGGQRVTAVMNSIVGNQEVLSADDIAGGQYLYGARPVQPPHRHPRLRPQPPRPRRLRAAQRAISRTFPRE